MCAALGYLFTVMFLELRAIHLTQIRNAILLSLTRLLGNVDDRGLRLPEPIMSHIRSLGMRYLILYGNF